MVAPTKLNLKIYQGSTFKEILRWEQSKKGYAAITGITKAAPMVISSVAHGLPKGWRFKVSDVLGMKEVNSTDYLYSSDESTTDTLVVNEINSSAYTAYVSGGIIEYNLPYTLTGATARMQIREKIDSTDTIDELTTENGGISINTSLNTITIIISATKTATYSFSSAVYSLEVINASAEVLPLVYGSVSLVKETTR